MVTASQLVDQALELPEHDRMEIAHRLLQSVGGDAINAHFDGSWLTEIQRRRMEIHAGSAELDDWETVTASVRGHLNKESGK